VGCPAERLQVAEYHSPITAATCNCIQVVAHSQPYHAVFKVQFGQSCGQLMRYDARLSFGDKGAVLEVIVIVRMPSGQVAPLHIALESTLSAVDQLARFMAVSQCSFLWHDSAAYLAVFASCVIRAQFTGDSPVSHPPSQRLALNSGLHPHPKSAST
jgi:hypothetical protein